MIDRAATRGYGAPPVRCYFEPETGASRACLDFGNTCSLAGRFNDDPALRME